MTNNTVTAPKGFLAAGVACGIKQSGKPDVGMIVCPGGATAAAVFTTNKIVSAGVLVSKEHSKSRKIYAVVVNSGNANACTGRRGIQNAIKMCTITASLVKREAYLEKGAKNEIRDARCDGRNVLVASTGIIGHRLPMDKVAAGIKKAAARLSSSAQAGLDFAKTIMTTDTKCKQAVRVIKIGVRGTSGGARVTIVGTVKGAGMIAPRMATTLLFITTDAAITKPLLNKALKHAVGQSLNKLTVDGHQSTNDTGIILASHLARSRPIVRQCPRYRKFAAALADLCDDLAQQMALDAEGATRMFKVVIKGAATKADAATAARAVADYPLLKCAIHGGDPNWGRIICAVGSSGVNLNPSKLSCKLDDVVVFRNGAPADFDRKRASNIVSQLSHTITVDLGVGSASDFCYGCDLGAGYVRINADYHT
jgi:glutamate N-acetyltransferase/amino-acid N-acetyltransferase